jgi:phage/plasmid-associated DNA primase
MTDEKDNEKKEEDIDKEIKDIAKELKNSIQIDIQNGIKTLNSLVLTGPNDIFNYLMNEYTFEYNGKKIKGIKTIADPDSDKEDIYIYNNGFYVRGEPILKEKAESFFRSVLNQCNALIKKIEISLIKNKKSDSENKELTDIDQEEEKKIKEELKKLKNAYEKMTHKGVITWNINEALNMVRRNTYTTREKMNPPTHIPFKNGYINLHTGELEPLNPELFYTWYINANYLNRPIDPKTDLPEFVKFLSTLVAPEHLLDLLFYSAYATLYPDLPNHKVLWLVGKQRIGKGSLVRLLKLLNPYGFESMALSKILRGEKEARFDLSSYETKNLVSDMEITEKERREKDYDWALFNKVFGGDIIDLEEKFRKKRSGTLKIKGIFIQNLPMMKIKSDATIERSIVIPTLDSVITEKIPHIEEKIFEKEGDAIATYFVHLLKILKMMNFKFPEKFKINEKGEIVEWEELDYDTKWDLINTLSDEVQFFIEEMTDTPEFNENEEGLKQSSNMYEHPVDEIHSIFVEWCKEKGITPISKQTFTEKFGYIYPKKRKRDGKKRIYVFTNLILKNDSQVGTPKKIQKDMQDNNSEYMKCLSQLMSISIISLPPKEEESNNKGVILEHDTKLGHPKITFKVITGLNFENKGGCPNLKTWSKILEKEGGQGSGQGSSEGIPIEEFSKIEQGSNEEKGEESISDSQALKDYRYFKSDEYFSNLYFKDFGIQNVEHKEFEKTHYYKIPYSEISKDKYNDFSSRFASKSNLYVIDEKEYNSIKEEEEKEK